MMLKIERDPTTSHDKNPKYDSHSTPEYVGKPRRREQGSDETKRLSYDDEIYNRAIGERLRNLEPERVRYQAGYEGADIAIGHGA